VDIATLVGILCGLVCIGIAVFNAGGAAVFVHVPSMLIVIGGMVAATFIHFSLGQTLSILPVMKKTLLCKLPPMQQVIQDMVNYAAIARRDGALALEQQAANVENPFLLKALQLLVDGQEEEAIKETLSAEIQYLQERHAIGKKILEFMGASAPAFGMIGTLIGLVAMLRNLSNPSELGAGMAVALITTFYGALVANLFFIPLAGKLEIRSKQETLVCEMILEGTVGIACGESPTVVRERMQTFISVKHREELRPNIGDEKSRAA